MKRLGLLVLSLILVASFLCFAGGQKEETGKKAPVVLSMWSEMAGPPNGPVMDEIVEKFNESQSNIIVMHTKFENTPFETAIKAAFAGGQPPDVLIHTGGGATFQFAKVDELVDLTDFITEMESLLLPGVDVDLYYQEKYWGIPWGLRIGNILWYNSEILAEHNINVDSLNTWSGFMVACEKFKQKGITPLAFGNKEGWPGNHWFTHLSRRMLTNEEYVAINVRTLDPTVRSTVKWSDPRPVKAWELYRELLDKGYFSPGYLSDDFSAAFTYFFQGKAAFMQTGGWLLSIMLSQSPEFPLDFVLFPEIEGYPGKQNDIVTSGSIVSIAKRGKHHEEAKEFLRYLTTEEAVRLWSEGVSQISPYNYDPSVWTVDHPLMLRMMKLLNESPSVIPFADHLEEYEINVPHTWEAGQGILTGDLSPQEAGKLHEEDVQEFLKKQGWR